MAFSSSAFFEVQGLALCPADDHPNDHCSVPDEGEWHTLFHLLSATDGERTLGLVMESDSPIYERFEDFRLTKPVQARLDRFLAHDGYAWERSNAPKRRRKAEPVAEVTPILKNKKRKKAKAS